VDLRDGLLILFIALRIYVVLPQMSWSGVVWGRDEAQRVAGAWWSHGVWVDLMILCDVPFAERWVPVSECFPADAHCMIICLTSGNACG
jgi:hypothetical protein